MKFFLYVFTLFILIHSPRLSAEQRKAVRPEASPILKINNPDTPAQKQAFQTPKGEITLIDALSAALRRNPMLAAYSFEIRAREAETLQAGLLPNPEIALEIENFAGDAPFRGVDNSEITLSVGQLIELGGKRSKRKETAGLQSDLAAWDYEIARLLVFSEVVKSFNAVLAAQKRVELDSEIVNIAEQFLQRIEYRVKAGNLSSAEVARARVALASNRILLQAAQKDLSVARRQLAATWGEAAPAFDKVIGNLERVTMIPQLDDLITLISHNPEIERWALAVRLREKEFRLEKAKRLPDPTIAGGYRRLNEIDANALVMSLSMPLPIFDRNQGAVESAEMRRLQVEYEKQSVEIELKTQLAAAWSRLDFVYAEIQTLKTEILVQAQSAYETINRGYNMGKFSFLDLLDAQRTLFDHRARYLDALLEYHSARAEIERLIGRNLSSIQE